MKQKYSVLVIDDQANWLKLLTEILENQFEVVSASNYDDALTAIEKRTPPFHVVVTDMRLRDDVQGNDDGLKLIKYINQRGDETKTIVVTGYATIDTTKQALSRLAAYDYLEKRSSARSLDYKEFRQIVYQAAEEAETKRPHGFTDLEENILLLEPDPVWRDKLKDSLGENGYSVVAMEIDEKLELYLKNEVRRYALILISESLSDENLLAVLHTSFPDAKMIVLTSRDIDNIFRAMRDYPVLTAFTIRDESFDPRTFREFIHSALAYGARKYILTQICFDDRSILEYPGLLNSYEIKVGNKYNVTLSIQDTPAENATPIWLSPGGAKKAKAQLHLFIHATRMKLDPGTDAYWEVSLSGKHPHPYKFSIIPQVPGDNEITVEIDQNQRWLGRISIKINAKQTN